MNSHSLAKTSRLSRELLVHRVRVERWKPSEAAEAFGISERTAYKWLARYRDEGLAGLSQRSSRPRRSPRKTPAELVKLVMRLRRQRASGSRIATQLKLSRSTVYRLLKKAGLSRLKNLEPKEPVRRYERRRPGDLVHVDIKKLGRFRRPGKRVRKDKSRRNRGSGWEFVHVCVDDASRLAYVEVLPTERGPCATAFMRRAIAWFRRLGIRIREVMTDNGAPYRFPSGLFGTLLEERAIRHLKTRPYRPQTNGKAERFIQTLLREWAYARSYASSTERLAALKPWLRYYNRERPHGSLKSRPPISRIRKRR